MGATKVVMESDSKCTIDLIYDSRPCLNELGSILQDIALLLVGVEVFFIFVP